MQLEFQVKLHIHYTSFIILYAALKLCLKVKLNVKLKITLKENLLCVTHR